MMDKIHGEMLPVLRPEEMTAARMRVRVLMRTMRTMLLLMVLRRAGPLPSLSSDMPPRLPLPAALRLRANTRRT